MSLQLLRVRVLNLLIVPPQLLRARGELLFEPKRCPRFELSGEAARRGLN
jgi:hypothetical protein